MRFKFGEQTLDVSDEEIEKILAMHKAEKEEKDKNMNALKEVMTVASAIEEQLNSLKLNIKGLEDKINESDKKINEEIILG